MNKIITIGRQCGSGGHTIGKQVAEQLGVPFYDKQIMEIVAERSGLSKETIEQQGEYAPASVLYSIAKNISYGYNLSEKGTMPLPDQIFAFQRELIEELAERESCVIVGRCADYILRDMENSLHVFICADSRSREKRVIEEHRVPETEAAEHIRSRDKKRAQHYKHYTEQTWGLAENYHLCLDSSYLGIDRCVQMIVDCAKK